MRERSCRACSRQGRSRPQQPRVGRARIVPSTVLQRSKPDARVDRVHAALSAASRRRPLECAGRSGHSPLPGRLRAGVRDERPGQAARRRRRTARDEHLRPPADRAVARPRLLASGTPTAASTSTAWAASPSTRWATPTRKLVPALQDQIAKLIHSSNYYHVPLQEQLAAKLCELSGLTNVFFCSTGLEANEAALKIARKFGHDKGIDRPEIIVYEKAFHGRSIATLSATGNPKVQAGFGPLVEGFVRVPLNDVGGDRGGGHARNPNVVAVFLEMIQGEGGINPAHRRLPAAPCAALCDEQRLAADARRGAVRHRPHRQVVRAPVGRHPARRDAAGQGPGLGRAGRRGRLRPEGGRRASARATTAPPSAATRWRCAPASRRCASWKKTACWPTPPRSAPRCKAGLAARTGRRGGRASRSAARA